MSTPLDQAARIDALWDFDEPARSEAAFRELLAEAQESGDRDYTAQVFTQIARAQGLQRSFDDAHATLDGVESMLDETSPLVRVRYQLERGRVLNSSGQADDARPLFVGAWEESGGHGFDFYTVDAAHMIAIVMPPEEALRWNEQALAVAQASDDERARNWEGSLCNNIGWTLHAAGEYEQALVMFERALEARTRQGTTADIRIARWCVARCLRSLNHVEEALDMQQVLLAEGEAAGAPDGYTHEEIGECLLALDRPEEARPHFARAYEILSKDPWLAEREPQRLERLSRLGGN
ncbi:MAG: tetratricopeptide repeat protein [Planctomycetota bacterium]|jgi:tetratricopeptide (TPR) repeat protein